MFGCNTSLKLKSNVMRGRGPQKQAAARTVRPSPLTRRFHQPPLCFSHAEHTFPFSSQDVALCLLCLIACYLSKLVLRLLWSFHTSRREEDQCKLKGRKHLCPGSPFFTEIFNFQQQATKVLKEKEMYRIGEKIFTLRFVLLLTT